MYFHFDPFETKRAGPNTRPVINCSLPLAALLPFFLPPLPAGPHLSPFFSLAQIPPSSSFLTFLSLFFIPLQWLPLLEMDRLSIHPPPATPSCLQFSLWGCLQLKRFAAKIFGTTVLFVVLLVESWVCHPLCLFFFFFCKFSPAFSLTYSALGSLPIRTNESSLFWSIITVITFHLSQYDTLNLVFKRDWFM